MSTIARSIRETTLYTVEQGGVNVYETFDYDKAQQMQRLVDSGIVGAECVDCKAVIPVSMVNEQREYRCPASTSVHYPGHRVPTEDYRRFEGGNGPPRPQSRAVFAPKGGAS